MSPGPRGDGSRASHYQTTFDATAFLGTAAGYLVITLPMIRAVTWLERRLRSGVVGIAGR